jgi:putative sigma-54 modulation protein
MQLNIHSQNLKLTPKVEEFAQSKLGKLDRYLPNISSIRLDLSRNHTKRGEDLTVAQITLRHARGAILRAEERMAGEDNETVIKAINAVSEKIFRQIERFKGKTLKNKRGRGMDKERFIISEEELEVAEEVPNYAEIAEEYAVDETSEEIFRRKTVNLLPMTEDEAIEQMELLSHKFFMFLNSATHTINIVYIRDGGGYGVLVPENISNT